MAFLKGNSPLPRKFSGGSGSSILDEVEHQQTHQELERLYTSTRAAKHFQKDVVKGVEGLVSTGKRQLEIEIRFGQDCTKYGLEGASVTESLSRATQHYGSARGRMEKERENFHRVISLQVAEPLKAMVQGSPLEDARHLKQKYDRLRESVDSHASEVQKRKTKDANGNPEHAAKLRAAEQKLDEIISAMNTMGKNATSAMSVVETQQQQTTLHKMLSMVEAERAYFQRVTSILDTLHHEIESEVKKSSNPSVSGNGDSHNSKHREGRIVESSYSETPSSNPLRQAAVDPPEPSYNVVNGSNRGYEDKEPTLEAGKVPAAPEPKSFYATATHDFVGEDEGELTISVGDEVLVRQVTSSGWSEGQCNGQSGWFPSTYVEKKQPIRKGRGKLGGSSR